MPKKDKMTKYYNLENVQTRKNAGKWIHVLEKVNGLTVNSIHFCDTMEQCGDEDNLQLSSDADEDDILNALGYSEISKRKDANEKLVNRFRNRPNVIYAECVYNDIPLTIGVNMEGVIGAGDFLVFVILEKEKLSEIRTLETLWLYG